jgi:hypothetical protein
MKLLSQSSSTDMSVLFQGTVKPCLKNPVVSAVTYFARQHTLQWDARFLSNHMPLVCPVLSDRMTLVIFPF